MTYSPDFAIFFKFQVFIITSGSSDGISTILNSYAISLLNILSSLIICFSPVKLK